MIIQIESNSPLVSNNCTKSDYSSLDMGKNCYKVYLDKKTWPEAKSHCEQVDGAKLVSIKDGFEQSFMHLLTYVKTQADAWIGLVKVLNIFCHN